MLDIAVISVLKNVVMKRKKKKGLMKYITSLTSFSFEG